jgi:hypothetical protein
MNTPVVLNEEEFDIAVDVIEEEEGWTIDDDAIIDPDGNIAVTTSEQGQGMIEWLTLSGVVAFGVLAVFQVVGPAFVAAFNTYITACAALAKPR